MKNSIKSRTRLVIASLIVCIYGKLSAQETTGLPELNENEFDKRMEWFGKAKLGIFIHWGIYAVNGVSESWSFFNNYIQVREM